MSYKDTYHSLKVILTDKTFFIFNPKIGSRFMESLFDKPGVEFQFKNGNFSEVTSQRNGEITATYLKSVMAEWELIVTSKSKKDIVILYRDPLKRFITALTQDIFSGNIPSISRYLVRAYFSSMGFTLPQIKNFYRNITLDDKFLAKQDDLKVFDTMCTLLIDAFIKGLTDVPVHSTHFTPHNPLIVQMLISNKIDLNKVKIFNIDDGKNELEDYLEKNEIDISNTGRQPNSSHIKNLIKNYIESSDSYIIPAILSSEVDSFRMLNMLKIQMETK